MNHQSECPNGNRLDLAVECKPERATSSSSSEGLDSGDSYSSMSENDFVEFSEWDAEFNQPGEPDEVAPCPLLYTSSQVVTDGEPTQKIQLMPNGRLGCKSLANLHRQLFHKKHGKRGARERDDDIDNEDANGDTVTPPPPKRQHVETSDHRQVDATQQLEFQQSSGQIVGVQPSVQVPHPRHDCTTHPFEFFDASRRDPTWSERSRNNQQYCPSCYCFVCEVKAAECTDFERHCNANDRDDMKSYWKFQRSKKQEEKRNRHFRFQCAVHMFRHCGSTCPWPVEMWEQRSWFNKRFCRECVCFVCNKAVIDCTDWSEHCNANNFDDMASFWRFERERTMQCKEPTCTNPVDG